MPYGTNERIIALLYRIIEGYLDIANARNSKEYNELNRCCPVLVSLICEITKAEGFLQQEVRDVLKELMDPVEATFDHLLRQPADYPAPSTVPTELAFFPQWPVVCTRFSSLQSAKKGAQR